MPKNPLAISKIQAGGDSAEAGLSALAKLAADPRMRQSALFEFREFDGSKMVSDKVYGLFLAEDEPGSYSLMARWGARSAAKLSEGSKGSGLTLPKAREAFEKEKLARAKKDYAEIGAAQAGAETGAASGPPEGFFMTRSVAKKVPSTLNDGFSRPSLAACWAGGSLGAALKVFEEVGGDCMYSDFAMVPSARAREAAVIAKGCVEGGIEAALAYRGRHGRDGKKLGEEDVVLLGLWEGPEEGYSLLGAIYVSDGDSFWDFDGGNPIVAAVREIKGSMQVASSGNDNYPGEAISWMGREWEENPADRERIERMGLDFAKIAWPEAKAELADGGGEDFARLLMARMEAQEIEKSSSPASRSVKKAPL